MEPIFTNEAVVLGLLIVVLGAVFFTEKLESKGWKRFYTFAPSLLLCYFIPALLHYPLGLIAPHYFEQEPLEAVLKAAEIAPPEGWGSWTYEAVRTWLEEKTNLEESAYMATAKHSNLYFMASRYLLPVSLILLCLSIDIKGLINLGPKALIMFFAASVGIILGGPAALLLTSYVAPGLVDMSPDELWRGLSTVAGSWIGGGANQTAMKEVFEVPDNIFAAMIVVDVIVANIWMGFLLYGVKISDKVDRWLKADSSAIKELEERVSDYRMSVAQMPSTYSLFIMAAVGFGGLALAHAGADWIVPLLKPFEETLNEIGLSSLLSAFFWLIVLATTYGLVLSFTPARKLEGLGASRWGSLFIYILVATIGMKMNLGEVVKNLGLFAIGICWMLVHVGVLLLVAKLIRAPFFFVAVGSQANVGGAASAPVVASAFSPALAPVGVLMAVLGYALGTYGAIICALMMKAIAG